jgi:hypothetical protein
MAKYHEDDCWTDRDWERHDAMIQDRHDRARNSTACRCGSDMPGTCPGPANCPMCETDDEFNDESEEE